MWLTVILRFNYIVVSPIHGVVTILCFQIPEDTVKNSRFSYIEKGEPVSLEQLGKSKSSPESGYQTYIESCIAGLLKVINSL